MRWSSALLFALAVELAVGCDAAAPGLTFDPCQPIAVAVVEPTPARVASVDAAIAMWQALGVVGLVRSERPDEAVIGVEFREAASTFHGYYDGADATIYVNVDLVDPAPRTITIAHELGHALALGHIDPDERTSVMNPGNVLQPPDEGDRRALDAIWAPCMR